MMNVTEISWLSVILAALSAFLLGGLWYGPLFGKAWARENGLNEETLGKRNMVLVFGLSFLFSLIAAVSLAMFIGPDAGAGFGAIAGCMAGLSWVAAFTAIQYLFEKRSTALFFINAGYSVFSLTLMGLIIGAWP